MRGGGKRLDQFLIEAWSGLGGKAGSVLTPRRRSERIAELDVVLRIRRNIGDRAGAFLGLVLALDMAAQGAFTRRLHPAAQLFRHRLLDPDIGLDAGSLDRGARRRVVERRGQAERGFRIQRNDRLDRPLAERCRAQNGGATVILQRAGNDFRCRGRAAIDQYDHRLAAGQIARAGVEPPGFLGIAAAGGDDLAAIEECVGHADRLIEQTARIEPQVEHEALELVLADFIGDLLDRIGEVVVGLLGERDHAKIADVAPRPGSEPP